MSKKIATDQPSAPATDETTRDGAAPHLDRIRIAVAQINYKIGDFDRNFEHIQQNAQEARKKGADLLIFTESALSGYLPGDLLEHEAFVGREQRFLERVAALSTHQMGILLGYTERDESPTHADGSKPHLYNSAALCQGGKIRANFRKSSLAGGRNFDESRYFTPGAPSKPVPFKGIQLGVLIGENSLEGAPINESSSQEEDASSKDALKIRGDAAQLLKNDAHLVIQIAASAYHSGKPLRRDEQLGEAALELGCPLVFVNHIGGQDELIYDGNSRVFKADGTPGAKLASFEEDFYVGDVLLDRNAIENSSSQPSTAQSTQQFSQNSSAKYSQNSGRPTPQSATELLGTLLENIGEVRQAIVLGLRDYAQKSGLKRATLGLSGGIDSALCAAIAAEALGAQNILGVAMPTRFTNKISNIDARALADALGCDFISMPIDATFEAFLKQFEPIFAGRQPGVTEENLQARIRGASLMALSNKFGGFVLVPGNKSEIAMGYSTLYGDMVGAICPLGDCLKTQVYAIARDINEEAGREIIPRRTIERAPTAELKPDQSDQDSLPPYDKLDPIIAGFVHHDLSAAELVDCGYDVGLVKQVLSGLFGAEFKRRQAAPILQISPRAFGPGRRYPLAAKFTDLW